MVAPSSVGITPASGSTPVAAGAVAAVLSFSAEAAGQATTGSARRLSEYAAAALAYLRVAPTNPAGRAATAVNW